MQAIIVALLIACAPAIAVAQPRPVLKDVEAVDRAMTNRAYSIFKQQCPGITKLAPLIEQITVWDMPFVLGEEAESRKWPIGVSVKITFRRAATQMAFDEGVPLLSDYVFTLGGGIDPGVLSSATHGLQLCVSHYPSNFMAVRDLQFLTQWPSIIADDRAHPHRKLDSTVYPLGEGPIMPAPHH